MMRKRRRTNPTFPLLVLLVVLLLPLERSLALQDPKKQYAEKVTEGGALAKKKIRTALRGQVRSVRRSERRDHNHGGNNGLLTSSASTIPSLSPNGISVEAFLLARPISIRIVLRTCAILGMMWAFVGCVHTCGIPRARTIWQLLQDGTSGAAQSIIPPDYRPSPFETHLAKLILSASGTTNIMLPPSLLPSAGPILMLVASAFAYLCFTILMPRWSTAFRVFLDYCVTDSPAMLSTTSPNKGAPKIFALVRQDVVSRPAGERESTSVMRNVPGRLLLCPVEESCTSETTTSSSTRRRKRDSQEDPNRLNSDAIEEAINWNYVHPTKYYFEVDHCRIYCDPSSDTRDCIDGSPTLHRAPLAAIQALVEDAGGLSQQQRTIAKERYLPYNQFTLPEPSVLEVFLTSLSSPLGTIQLLGRIMSCLEDGAGALTPIGYSLFQHYRNARQAVTSASQMAEDVRSNLQHTTDCPVHVWNADTKEWTSMVAGDLLPGDIFRLPQGLQDDTPASADDASSGTVVPVDALVLKGTCLTNEAVLTGESIPQVKTPIDYEWEIDEGRITGEGNRTPVRRLDIQRDKGSILFAGTLLRHTGSRKPSSEHISETEKTDFMSGNQLTCLVLRTGTYSSKGKLASALRGTPQVGTISNAQEDRDAVRLIAFSTLCATIACCSLFFNEQGTVSPFRRVIQCTRIALASIPSDLPLALSSIARTCSIKLRMAADVVCSVPGSLLTAAYVDTVVFDKTGTLTADTQSLALLESPMSKSNETDSMQRVILAGCHSLVHLSETSAGKNEPIGDPLDKAALAFTGWRYDPLTCSYYRPGTASEPTEPVRLWQIRSFPFDPTRRLSSAIVLVQFKNDDLQLWKLTKGSPETIKGFFKKDVEDFDSSFDERTEGLEMLGYRCIAMGVENISNSTISSILFPDELSTDNESLITAKSKGDSLHRNEIEGYLDNEASGLTFCGFCCFDASVRPSSKRVIKELNRGGLNTVMLTGDSSDAAVCVARKVNVIGCKKMAVLETRTDAETGDDLLVWKHMRTELDPNGSFRILRNFTKFEEATLSSSLKLFKRREKGQLSLAASGDALEVVLKGHQNDVHRLIARNLHRIAVIARATPDLKKTVIDSLKYVCACQVMMSGDGINDVAAIQSADVAAALLNGFGAEDDITDVDFDDHRRRKDLQSKRIGSNRKVVLAGRHEESVQRVRKQIETARKEIEGRVALRKQNGPSSDNVQYTGEDIKDIIQSSWKAITDEMDRARRLKKGGGEAARILAAERKQVGSTTDKNEETAVSPTSEETTIKPGEVSLVAPFSCLHPSIDGVDAILRQGIATAASVLATKQVLAVNSLLSCYYLTTLYRDGFRYGNNMWHVDSFLDCLTWGIRSNSAFTPRPRLPASVIARPPRSLFHPLVLFSTLCQAIIHVVCMGVSVNFAAGLERDTHPVSKKRDRIGLRTIGNRHGEKFHQALLALSQHSRVETETGKFSLFGRPPFRPNYKTNVVFMFNILQTAIRALMDHTGKPFYQSILECRDLCLAASATVLFFVVCVSGTILPYVTVKFLQLRPFPTKGSKLTILGIAGLNILSCGVCRWILDDQFAKVHRSGLLSERTSTFDNDETNTMKDVAADYEEQLLEEETSMNVKKLQVFAVALCFLLLDIVVTK